MSRLNEAQIIKIFQRHLNKNFVSEDVETFKIGKTSCVVKLDTLVESTDIPPKIKLQDVARKSIVACVSDFAAKGVKPLYAIISVTIPRKFTKSKIQNLAKGFGLASKEFDIKILGGDTNEGRELVIQVFLVGTSDSIVPRKAAKTNDIIITSGPFGYSAAGLKILLENKKADSRFSKKATGTVFKPRPKLRFGLQNSNYFTSAMDSSDGLSTTLYEMAKQSRKKFVITNLPTNFDLLEFARKNKLDPLDLVFNGGEEYEIVATVNPAKLQKLKKNAKKRKVSLFEIGFVTAGRGVQYWQGNNTLRIENLGWMHFSN
ncbi:MAG: thiamine-phosphate kinase [Nitrososphaerota archaeon]